MLKILVPFLFVTHLFSLTPALIPTHYLLPDQHPLRQALDTLFAEPCVLDSQTTLNDAGFVTLYHQASGMRVLRHASLPGYLIKTYVNTEWKRSGDDIQWMVDRCLGAENIRHLIQQKNLRHFTVPDKWIYFLPGQPFSNPQQQIAVLVVTNMKLVSRKNSVKAWKTRITKQHLQELYCLLSHGFGSLYLPYNIPYTKKGTFACIDTAYPYRKFTYEPVKRYLAPHMSAYWDRLTHRQP